MSDATGSTTNSALIGVASLSIVSTVGMIGTCVWNYRDVLLEKMKCVISFNTTDQDDIEAGPSAPAPPTPPSSPIGGPSITFPIIINNSSSGLEGRYPISIPLISPFSSQPTTANAQPVLERHHSDPAVGSSDASSEDATSNESPPVVSRQTLDGYQTS